MPDTPGQFPFTPKPRKAGEPSASRINPETDARIPIARERASEMDWGGRHIGPYLVERKLSKGGMGLVLLGYDEALRRPVAIKVMEAGLLQDHDALKRFEREARATAAVQHPNIAQVYLVGLAEDNTPFLSMEYIDGGSMMDAIRARRAFTFSEVAGLMEQVASALGAARKFNIIHRDIKPANIMLTQAGVAKVVDFGLAKIFFEDSYRTQEGMVLGTPSYMAPEQGQGRTVDHRADIYALGATFYHLILGRPPFTADSPVQIMMKHVTAPLIPMKSLNPAVPVEFDEVIGRCLRKDVDERYQDYESLLTDIKRLRLQWTAREQGPIITHEHSAAPAQGAVFPPPPSGAFGPPPPSSGGSSPAVPHAGPQGTTLTVRHAAGVNPWDPNAPAEEGHGWTPLRIALVAGAAFLLFLAVAIPAALSFLKQDQSAPPPRETVRKPAIAIWLERLAKEGDGSAGGAQPTVNHDYVAYKATVEVLGSLRNGVDSYEADEGELPGSLLDVATPERVLMNFETDGSGAPLDGWGQPIAFDTGTGAVRSAGLDQSFYTDDDLVSVGGGAVDIPDEYAQLSPRL